MEKSGFKTKDFGTIFVNTFKIYFGKFFRNIGVSFLFMLIPLLCMLPYMASIYALDIGIGYPMFDGMTAAWIGLGLSGVLMLIASNILYPSLQTGYFAPLTSDSLEGKTRERGERSRILFRNFPAVFLAQTCGLVLKVIPFGLFMWFWVKVVVSFNYSNALYGLGKIGEIMGVYFLFIIAFGILSLFMMFIRHNVLFEGKKGFKAVFDSFKLVGKGNFWRTLGHILLFGLILYIVMYIVIFIIGIIAIASVMPSIIMELDTALSPGGIVGLSIAGVIMIIISLMFYGLMEIYISQLYFNARTKRDNIPFPGDDEIVEEKK